MARSSQQVGPWPAEIGAPAYDTQADRLGLEAILDRYADDDTEEIRSILSAQASNRFFAAPAVGPLG